MTNGPAAGVSGNEWGQAALAGRRGLGYIAGMTEQDAQAERRFERRLMWQTMALVALSGILFTIIDVLSAQTEFERAGQPYHPVAIWIYDPTSVLVIVALAPLVMAFANRFRFADTPLPLWLAGHAGAALLFSTVHIALMVWLRKLVFFLFFDRPYIFTDNLPRDFVYELRKDILSYAFIVLVLFLLRTFAEQRRELAAARRDARETRLIALKCGGRTMRFAADSFRYAQSAGNYVEVHAGNATHFARATLAGLEALLHDAGLSVARVHRSYLVNRDAIETSAPSGSGDLVLTLAGGETVPCSRRYRDAIDA
ncbi:LytTR family transcriptional regulator [Parasphingopyxis algicola]|uniref:LytTR family DNA-binding domain-containing protein n=1 Tax=Parasphingopyxis algicola TaxID=2026624 RepID=UPI0015A055FF|nr:LytTR family DNA-binding domain-containing protein [Parasphingopyxis algicola]QLC23627.1 LytTR family transcriptional regulator [Parasphingopyxis algicola]